MAVQETTNEKLTELLRLVEEQTPEEGIHETSIPGFITFRNTETHGVRPQIYEPGVIFLVQGKKYIYLKGKRFHYNPGNYMGLFVPLPVECEVIEASQDKPLLGAAMVLDRNRLSDLLVRMDRIDLRSTDKEVVDPSGIYSAPIEPELMDAIIRLFRTLKDPTEALIVGEGIIDEIYFRLLTGNHGQALKSLVERRGQIREISRAVEYVHQNLDKPVSVDEMADMVNMSSSGFHKKFKEVMHLSPLQYAKSIKLGKAQNYIVEGKSATEAGYLVGYNSPAQFSREYKRHFGVAPSVHKG